MTNCHGEVLAPLPCPAHVRVHDVTQTEALGNYLGGRHIREIRAAQGHELHIRREALRQKQRQDRTESLPPVRPRRT